jgi:hypothetical protein
VGFSHFVVGSLDRGVLHGFQAGRLKLLALVRRKICQPLFPAPTAAKPFIVLGVEERRELERHR